MKLILKMRSVNIKYKARKELKWLPRYLEKTLVENIRHIQKHKLVQDVIVTFSFIVTSAAFYGFLILYKMFEMRRNNINLLN